jgi:hypothetical protein
MAADHHIQFSSQLATLAGMERWPAAFLREGACGTARKASKAPIAAYDRIRGPKEIVVARGPAFGRDVARRGPAVPARTHGGLRHGPSCSAGHSRPTPRAMV